MYEYKCRKCSLVFEHAMVQVRCISTSCGSRMIHSTNTKYIRDSWEPIDWGKADRDRYEAGRPVTESITLLNEYDKEEENHG